MYVQRTSPVRVCEYVGHFNRRRVLIFTWHMVWAGWSIYDVFHTAKLTVSGAACTIVLRKCLPMAIHEDTGLSWLHSLLGTIQHVYSSVAVSDTRNRPVVDCTNARTGPTVIYGNARRQWPIVVTQPAGYTAWI